MAAIVKPRVRIWRLPQGPVRAESDDFDWLDFFVYINATSTRQSAFGAVFVRENVRMFGNVGWVYR